MTHAPVPADVVAAIPGAPGAMWSRLAGLSGGAWLMRPASGPAVVVRQATAREALAATAAAAAHIGPQVVASPPGWLAAEYLSGRHLSALELSRPTVLTELAELLCRWHRTDLALPEASLSSARAVSLAGIPPEEVPVALMGDAALADDWEARLGSESPHRAPAHLDVVANVMKTPRGLQLIDFEYAAAAAPSRELGQVVWEAELDRQGLERLVGAYGAGPAVGVEATAAWAFITGVTWTLWAMARQDDPAFARYAGRSWERLQRHWTRTGG